MNSEYIVCLQNFDKKIFRLPKAQGVAEREIILLVRVNVYMYIDIVRAISLCIIRSRTLAYSHAE